MLGSGTQERAAYLVSSAMAKKKPAKKSAKPTAKKSAKPAAKKSPKKP
jgi:hypothetical protein